MTGAAPAAPTPAGLTWVREEAPVWDADKRRVIGGAPDGAFVLPFRDGDSLPGEWWSVRADGDDGAVVAYGRLDIGWGGDAEILLAVDPDRQTTGVGSFVLASLEDEATARGLNYVYNTIREHEQRDLVHDWLVVRGFRGTVDGELRKRVGSDRQRPATVASSTARPGPSQHAGSSQGASGAAAYDPGAEGDRGPGHEESGGYVDVEDHQY